MIFFILSARAGEEEAAKGIRIGANDYIAKPFSARDLLVRIASNLATARAAREQIHIRQETERALALLKAELGEGDVVLVKASNSSRLGGLADELAGGDSPR